MHLYKLHNLFYYAQCRFAECYAAWHFHAEYCYTECRASAADTEVNSLPRVAKTCSLNPAIYSSSEMNMFIAFTPLPFGPV
jgi:hypothetical protein